LRIGSDNFRNNTKRCSRLGEKRRYWNTSRYGEQSCRTCRHSLADIKLLNQHVLTTTVEANEYYGQGDTSLDIHDRHQIATQASSLVTGVQAAAYAPTAMPGAYPPNAPAPTAQRQAVYPPAPVPTSYYSSAYTSAPGMSAPSRYAVAPQAPPQAYTVTDHTTTHRQVTYASQQGSGNATHPHSGNVEHSSSSSGAQYQPRRYRGE